MKKKANGHAGGRMPIYKSYVFRTKDPAIDELRTLAEKHFGKRINSKMLSQISEEGGPTPSCMRAWFFGATMRPKNPTLEAAGRAMGYRRVWQRMRANAKEEE
jgi:hypothetical protein